MLFRYNRGYIRRYHKDMSLIGTEKSQALKVLTSSRFTDNEVNSFYNSTNWLLIQKIDQTYIRGKTIFLYVPYEVAWERKLKDSGESRKIEDREHPEYLERGFWANNLIMLAAEDTFIVDATRSREEVLKTTVDIMESFNNEGAYGSYKLDLNAAKDMWKKRDEERGIVSL